jgi:hypothetical protein
MQSKAHQQSIRTLPDLEKSSIFPILSHGLTLSTFTNAPTRTRRGVKEGKSLRCFASWSFFRIFNTNSGPQFLLFLYYNVHLLWILELNLTAWRVWNIRIIREYAVDCTDKEGILPQVIVIPEFWWEKNPYNGNISDAQKKGINPKSFAKKQMLSKDHFTDEIFRTSGLGTVLVTRIWLLPDKKPLQTELNNMYLAHISLVFVISHNISFYGALKSVLTWFCNLKPWKLQSR